MKRPDIRLPWREKVSIFWLIFILSAVVGVFYIIIEFGHLLCPNFDKAWTSNEVAEHQGTTDYWVSVQGAVYDLTNFRRCLVQIGIARLSSRENEDVQEGFACLGDESDCCYGC